MGVFFLQNGFISVVYESILGHSSAFVFFCEILSRVSIHTFVCLPRLRVPYTWRYNAFTGSLLSSILTIWPNHVSLSLQILSASARSVPTSSGWIMSRQGLPAILLSQLICASRILLASSIPRLPNSGSSISTEVTKCNVLYSVIFVLADMLFTFRILLNLPNFTDARPNSTSYGFNTAHLPLLA